MTYRAATLIVACSLNIFGGDNRMNNEYLYKIIDQLVLKEELGISDIESAFGIRLQKKEFVDIILGGDSGFSIYEPADQKVPHFFTALMVKTYSDDIPGWGVISFELPENECYPWRGIEYSEGERAVVPDAGGRLTSLIYKVRSSTVNFRKQRELECLFDVVINVGGSE